MSRSGFILSFLLCLAVVAPVHAQQQTLGAHAALAMPVSEMDEDFELGYGATVTYLYTVLPDFSIGASAGYVYLPRGENSLVITGGHLSSIPLMFAYRYTLPGASLRPYLGGEAGFHFMNTEAETAVATTSDSETAFGLGQALGMYIPAGSVTLDLQFRFDWVNTSGYDGTWMGFNAGVLFGL